MKDLLAAGRYAQALFDIARLTHQDEEIEAELDSLSLALKRSPEFLKFFDNPRLRNDQKRKFLQKIYQERQHEVYEVLLNFFTVLFEKGRFNLIHEIAVTFKRIADEVQGQGTAEIKTAAALDPKAEALIISRLEKMAGYKITVKKEIDASLIGGVMVKVRNKIIDGTVRHKIDVMKKELTKIRNI